MTVQPTGNAGGLLFVCHNLNVRLDKLAARAGTPLGVSTSTQAHAPQLPAILHTDRIRRKPMPGVFTHPTADAFDRVPIAVLVLANLAPLAGVLFFGWDARALLLLYWLENLVIGGWTLVRMVHLGGPRGLPMAAFFCFHYSFFCAGHGLFLLTLTGAGDESAHFDNDAGFPLLVPFYMLRGGIEYIRHTTPELLGVPLLALIVSHGISTVYHHFHGKEDRGRAPSELMFDPYKRIFALHVTIILSAIVLFKIGADQALPALLLLITIKIVLDVHQHRRAHRTRRGLRAVKKAPHDARESDENAR